MWGGKTTPSLSHFCRGKRRTSVGPPFGEYGNCAILKVLNRWLRDGLAFQTPSLNQPGTVVYLTYDAEDITAEGLAVVVKNRAERSAS
jgi:hypothetical protein